MRQLSPELCIPLYSFVHLQFDQASLVRSNLGGHGGPCCIECDAACDERETAATPHEMYLRDVGINELGTGWIGGDGGAAIDLRITNTSLYWPRAAIQNGMKRRTDGPYGSFGSLNLLGPGTGTSDGPVWSPDFTFVELRFEFLTRSSPWSSNAALSPATLPRTYVSFFDFDTGDSSTEAMQMDPTASEELLPSETELARHPTWADAAGETALNTFFQPSR